jgi:integration host factor subunit beta
LNHRPARTGRNPKSGEKVQVPPKYAPHFKAGKELRERVEQSIKPEKIKKAA